MSLIERLEAAEEYSFSFVQSVADVKLEDIDLEYAVANLLHGRGALDKKTKTDAVIAIKTLRDILRAAKARVADKEEAK